MGYATLGFPGGPGIRFRIDPQSINWGFNINATSINTIGGRVVQVTGATLSDITIQGMLGEDVAKAVPGGPLEHEGRSWRLAKRFAYKIRQMQEYQSRDAQVHAKMHQPAIFEYAPRGWRFKVYVKDLADPDGGVIALSTGKFSHAYVLTLFVVQDGTSKLVTAGTGEDGLVNAAKAQAINEYIGRISDGIGWKPTKYNGNFADYYGGQGLGDYGDDDAAAAQSSASPGTGIRRPNAVEN